jgi:hypothetical protein
MELMLLKKQNIRVNVAFKKAKDRLCKMDVEIWLKENSSLLNGCRDMIKGKFFIVKWMSRYD